MITINFSQGQEADLGRALVRRIDAFIRRLRRHVTDAREVE